jgi:hypothetical protein
MNQTKPERVPLKRRSLLHLLRRQEAMVRQGAKGRAGSIETNGTDDRTGSGSGYIDVEEEKITEKSIRRD